MPKPLQHILCVDDEKDILDVAQMCLETVGNFKVSCASSGRDAIAKAADVKPDLILIDVMMPEMDGPATLLELQNTPAIKSIPVVFMTARVQSADVQHYLELGAAGVIPKPFDPMELSPQVSDIWRRFNEK